MKTLLAAGAVAALSLAAVAAAPSIAAAAETVVHDTATGTTYIYKGKSYPRVHEVWVAPAGYTERVYVVGDTVPESIYGNTTYVIDTAKYPQLPKHTGDTQWVRVGNDAVLVRVGSGNVVDRIEGFYY